MQWHRRGEQHDQEDTRLDATVVCCVGDTPRSMGCLRFAMVGSTRNRGDVHRGRVRVHIAHVGGVRLRSPELTSIK